VRRPARAALAALAATAALALLAGNALGGAGAASTHVVILHEHAFHPPTLNIHRGDRVRWLWRDGETEHNVTFRAFHSATQASGSFTVRFTRAGTFRYFCTIHVSEGMRGKVIVH
jgi:plastocyanin